MAKTASVPTTPKTSAVPPPPEAAAAPLGEDPIDPAQRHAMIAETAFFIAQARSFTPSQELDDWLAAERAIEERLSSPQPLNPSVPKVRARRSPA